VLVWAYSNGELVGLAGKGLFTGLGIKEKGGCLKTVTTADRVRQGSGALVKILQVGLSRNPAPGLQLETFMGKTKLRGWPRLLFSLLDDACYGQTSSRRPGLRELGMFGC